jgi:uncharacterized protein YbjT (DUF2867 family)
VRLLVLGGTGGTGQQIVSQALESGHDVTVLAGERLPTAGVASISRADVAHYLLLAVGDVGTVGRTIVVSN